MDGEDVDPTQEGWETEKGGGHVRPDQGGEEGAASHSQPL